MGLCFFFFNDTATTEIYTLSLHDALPISRPRAAAAPALLIRSIMSRKNRRSTRRSRRRAAPSTSTAPPCSTSSVRPRSEEHTSELQSRQYLVCRLLLEKKNKNKANLNTLA